ncbi:TatD family hydrolase [Reinekea thalattae]|uniref:TatD family deoxyribonuclease n=1 Tax=Reinekea thalattae TaxID=2593301 RepID=A0A5C8Z9Y1_9GAMM|nr:TatD family hydrolase [Reinekea thalattae]TXR54762.1 TatD family deoxyribonuclease [Reinekea thalattae]
MSKTKRPIPVFDQPIIETHCHLDYLEGEAVSEVLERATAKGVERIVTISVSPDNLAKVRELTENPLIWGTQGIHPHDADAFTEATAAEILKHGNDDKIVAIGEIGLDYYYEHSDRAVQRKVFEQQLEIAIQLGQPIVVHTREADEDTQAILKNFSSQLKGNGVIHSFTSGLPLAEFCLNEGFMLGFNGIVTFNSAQNVRDVAAITPLDRMLVETDSPYLTPAPYRGRPNEPQYLPFIVEKLAEVKEQTVEVILEHTYQNAKQLFGWH